MADVIVATPGQLQGGTDRLEGFLKVFAGETIAAFEAATVTNNRHLTRTISSGKSAQFPVFGRAVAQYLKPGKSLDDIRVNIPQNEKVILLDGLLTSDVLIAEIEEAMAHFEVRHEYTKQCGEALALALDSSNLAEIAKLVVADKANITGAQGTGKGRVITERIAAEDIGITEATGKAIIRILLAAKAEMTKNKVPQSERYCYLDPEFHAALVASWVAINRDFGAMGTIVDGQVTKIAGFEIIEVPHLTDGGPDAANVLQGDGHVFPALYKNTKPLLIAHRTAIGTLKLKDLAMEHARRAEYQADQIIAKLAVGHGGLRPEAAFLGNITASV